MSVIQTLNSTLRIAPDGTRAESLNLIVPVIGSLTGNGTIASNGTLDFKMLVKLTDSNSLTRGVSRYASLGHPENGIAFRVAGTTANPVFAPDVAGVAGNFLGGLLGRRRP